MGSATSDIEHVPEPLLFVFTFDTTPATVSVSGWATSDCASTLICTGAFQLQVGCGEHGSTSLKIATVTLASAPRPMTFGRGALGLMSMRCVQEKLVVPSGLMVPPQSVASLAPLPSTSL